MSNYLLELSVIHMALILGYWLLLRTERHYAKMRFYLVASTLLALTIPLLKLPRPLFSRNEPIDAMALEAIPLDAMTITPVAEMSGWNYDLLIWIYAAISAFFLFKFVSGVVYLVRLERKSSCANFNGLYIRKVRDIKGSFTFFNWIFLSDEIDNNQKDYEAILKHEKAHASLGHTYDIMFFELFKVFFWWLPTAWFIIKEIKKIHEYQADACALKSCDVDEYASILISSTLETNELIAAATRRPAHRQAGLASSFHEGLILKRLIAMKQKVKNVSPWKLGALSVLCASLLIVFACSEELDQQLKEVGSQSNTIAFDQLPVSMEVVNVDTTDRVVSITFKKNAANFDYLADKSSVQGVFTVVEKQPEFEGGADAFYQYVRKEIKYPLEARQRGVEGRVDVQLVIGKDGSISDVKAIEGIGAGCDAEAVRVLQNAPSFKPGMQNGKPVLVRMVVPIVFRLNEGKTNPDNSTQGIIIVEKAQPKNNTFKVAANYADGEWSGTVYDEKGDVLPGANIVVGGTTTGTTSDLDGKFKLKARESNDLFISFIGYETVKLEGK